MFVPRRPVFHVKQPDNAAQEGVCEGSKGGLNRSRGGLERSRAGQKGAWIFALGLLAGAGCLSAAATAHDAAPAKPGSSKPAPAKPAPAPTKVAFTDNAKQGSGDDAPTRDFAYSWPAAVSAVPELARRFTAERGKLLADQKAEWTASLKEFEGQDCVSCVNRDFQKSWDVVADLPRFLSLSAVTYEYSGGAHGNHWTEALVWDRTAKKAFDPKMMFRSKAALQNALGASWCKALRAERAKRIGAEYADDPVFPCPPVSDLAVLVGSSDRKSFNRIGLIAAPYVAGSYSEGDYELTFPVTPAVLAAVKPEYKAFFALGK